MPIYAYRCESCGFQQDILRKMSDPLLVDCPSCGAPTFRKQVTAAGFQLKGSGWYVTDFRNPATKETSKPAESGDIMPKSDSASDTATKPAEAKPAADAGAPKVDRPAPPPAPKASPPPASDG